MATIAGYLHERADFKDLLLVVSDRLRIIPYLVEKDYWIMHVLYGLKSLGFDFELKGGTSLSKGYKAIHRFSEDIDILIHPPADLANHVFIGKNHTKPAHVDSRVQYYQWLAENIRINGIFSVFRDAEFDAPPYYFGGGIRLLYNSFFSAVEGVKEGILLEVGFDDVSPNTPITISSWAYDHAAQTGVAAMDNRAIAVKCYNPEYTFVEKLQAIIRKFAKEQADRVPNPNFLRQYYDVYELLELSSVRDFIGTEGYLAHKARRFNKTEREMPLALNKAFDFSDPVLLKSFDERFKKTEPLYYDQQPEFEDIIKRIQGFLPGL